MSSAPPGAIREPVGSPIRRHGLRRLRLQLRSRITIAFSLGGLLIFLAVATIVFLSARSTIVGQAVRSAETTTYANARSIQSEPSGSSTLQELTVIDQAANSLSLYEFNGSWIVPTPTDLSPPLTVEFGQNDLPASLVALVQTGVPAEQAFRFNGATYIGVGYQISGNAFYQIYPTTTVVRTLRALLLALLFSALLTMVLGAGLGRWAAHRVLRPLRDATRAASSIAAGQLDTRIETDAASDLAELASAFNLMVDGVQQRIEREARFASDVAHELRSPLTTLATSLAVIESRRDELPERSQQALELLGAEVQRFQRMVFDLLEISRLDAGAANLVLSIVSTGELVHAALISAGADDLPLVIDEVTEARYLNVDKRRFERIIANLVANAQRHAGGATRTVVTSDEEKVRIAIEDAGPGVAPEDRTRIFGRFARAATTAGSRGLERGTGLGLALVSEHVKLHGGQVWVEEATPAGARFVVELPLAPDYLVSDPESVEVS